MESVVVLLVIIVIAVGLFSHFTSKKNTSNSKQTTHRPIRNVIDKPVHSAPIQTAKTKTRQTLESGYARNERLTIKYATGNPDYGDVSIKTRNIDIYGLGDDYIDAYCYYRNQVRTFKLSRVLNASFTGETYQIPDSYAPSGWVTDGEGEIHGD